MSLREIPGVEVSYVAAADLSAKQFYGVDVDTNGKAALPAADGARCIGVLQDKPGSGSAGRVMVTGVSKAIAGEAISKGDLVKVKNGGKFGVAVKGKVDTSDAGAAADPVIGSYVVGIAESAAGADLELFSLLLLHLGVVPTTAA